MKKYLLLILLLIPAICYSDIDTVEGQALTDIVLLGPIGFESGEGYTNTDEIADHADWTEGGGGSTDIFVVSTGAANTGSQSAWVDTDGSGYRDYASFAEQSTNFTVELYINYTVCNGGGRVRVDDISLDKKIAYLKCEAADIWYFNGTVFVDATAADVVTTGSFYKLEIQVQPASDNFKLWYNGSLAGTFSGGEIDLLPDAFFLDNYTGDNTTDYYIDDLKIYKGNRQP